MHSSEHVKGHVLSRSTGYVLVIFDAGFCKGAGGSGSGGDGTGRSGNSNAQDEKGKATGADEVRLEMMEMAGEVGVKWTGRLLNVRS